MPAAGPGFDEAVADGGYRWWYIDALSDDRRHGLTIIALVGSVFSPYYARARRRGPASADAFCALNAVFYGPRGRHWAMTERGAGDLEREPEYLRVGPSALRWDGGALVIDICEWTVPWPRRLQGTVTLAPQASQPHCFALDSAARHHWWPAAPIARVSVAMRHPSLSWQGAGYLDSNWGAEPLEDAFSQWQWSRAHLPDGTAAVLYEPIQCNAERRLLAWQFHPGGGHSALPVGAVAPLPDTSIWRIGRSSRAESGTVPKVAKTLEDTPFYARSLISTRWLGEPALAVHESLSLERFKQPWVQCLLPFRMPRRAAAAGRGCE